MSRHAIVLLVFTCCVILCTCHPKPSAPQTSEHSELLNHRWLLKKLYLVDQSTLVPTLVVPDLITRLDNSFHGFGGCNSYSGLLTGMNGRDQGKVAFSDLMATEMYCQETSRLEQAWLNALATATHWKVQQDQLFLYKHNRLLATLEAWWE